MRRLAAVVALAAGLTACTFPPDPTTPGISALIEAPEGPGFEYRWIMVYDGTLHGPLAQIGVKYDADGIRIAIYSWPDDHFQEYDVVAPKSIHRFSIMQTAPQQFALSADGRVLDIRHVPIDHPVFTSGAKEATPA